MGYEEGEYSEMPQREDWVTAYEREAALIANTLREEIVFIEHIGSTAVPGLGGPADVSAIDILAIVRDVKNADCYATAFKMIGYDELPGPKFLKKGEPSVSLHIFPDEHPKMMAMLDVRDYLLAHPDEARKYKALKEKWLKKYPRDRGAYQEKKDEYLAKLSDKAGKWKGTHLHADE